MNRIFSAMFLLALVAAVPAVAQNHGGAGDHGAATQVGAPSPYSGMETRRAKALSEKEIADLEAGRGMGLALPAELNGYPGPSHVLELAAALGLTDKQTSRTKELLDQMKAETIPIGRRIIDEETMLDILFAEGRIRITAASLAEATKRIAVAQGALREAHLRYHLDMAELLTPEQVGQYGKLGGYAVRTD